MPLIILHSQSVENMSVCTIAELNHHYSQSVSSSITQLSYGMMFASLNLAIHTMTKLVKGTTYVLTHISKTK